jgi:hypothetical protein
MKRYNSFVSNVYKLLERSKTNRCKLLSFLHSSEYHHFPQEKTYFQKQKRYTYTCVAGVSGRVTQNPIFTCRKNLNSDDGSHKKPK